MLHPLFLVCILLCFGLNSNGQSMKPYPIPSWNVAVNGNSLFRESPAMGDSLTDVKKIVNIKNICIKAPNDPEPCNISIYLYSLDGLTILGPFYPACGETLSQEVDDRDWGVLIHSDCEITVDVWITSSAIGSPVPY